MKEPTTVAEAVRNGARLLDRRAPQWYRLIDLDTLDLSACERCICGQLGRSLGWELFPGMDDYDAEYGFDVNYELMGEDQYTGAPDFETKQYAALDIEWQKAIHDRLNRVPANKVAVA